MPTYEYACQACEHHFEEFQSITAAPLKKCPSCGKAKLKRLIGVGGGVIFKGSGFYTTDYRSESYKKSAEAEKPSSSSGDAKAAGAADSKPAADATTKKNDAGSTSAEKSGGGDAAKAKPEPAAKASKKAAK